jgi:hypothetical protein
MVIWVMELEEEEKGSEDTVHSQTREMSSAPLHVKKSRGMSSASLHASQ